MRAIDLYAGVGGWSLGLRLAGIDVVESYEWWQPAIDTHNGNHGGGLRPVDIRKLRLEDLPTDIDVVVGSPPCTEFSYSNRGGGGDIAEGLVDLVKFLEVVDYLKPKYWALENVPRVADVLRRGFSDPDHVLFRFAHLEPEIHVIDFSDYGTPQSRKRCIAGRVPFSSLNALRMRVPRRTLGDVIRALSGDEEVTDPIWGVSLSFGDLTETVVEPPLNEEELRMNREAKEYHAVYNNMAFPDPLEEPARTVTATCTRVSRESIVISDPLNKGKFRRLTIRERACLQGFPITYQFYGRSFAEKAKMVGNAIPPTFTFLLAQAVVGAEPIAANEFSIGGVGLTLPEKLGPVTSPDREGRTYPAKRSFRAALPGLRFKSGTRFELSNTFPEGRPEWGVRFFFGPSKDTREVCLDGAWRQEFRDELQSPELSRFRAGLRRAESLLTASSPEKLQLRWTHRGEGLSPYEVTDLLGALAGELAKLVEAMTADSPAALHAYVSLVADSVEGPRPLPSIAKLQRNAAAVFAGVVVGDWFNTLDWHREKSIAA